MHHPYGVTDGNSGVITSADADKASNGAEVLALLGANAIDDGFEADVRAARQVAALEGSASPSD